MSAGRDFTVWKIDATSYAPAQGIADYIRLNWTKYLPEA